MEKRILTKATLRLLQNILEQALSGNQGIKVLLTDASGTGKTLAAEWLATHKGIPLYRVDLSAVIRKYIGETEKNLGQLFESQANADVILLFDEAELLFGKRGEISDAHDPYTNVETNYLLKCLQSYRGILILSSNQKQNIDDPYIQVMDYILEVETEMQAERGFWSIIRNWLKKLFS